MIDKKGGQNRGHAANNTAPEEFVFGLQGLGNLWLYSWP